MIFYILPPTQLVEGASFVVGKTEKAEFPLENVVKAAPKPKSN